MDINTTCFGEQHKEKIPLADKNAFKDLKITSEQKQNLLENLDIEFDLRITKLKKDAEERAENARLKCHFDIDKIPLEIRQLPIEDFINIYNADPKEYFEKQFVIKSRKHSIQVTPIAESNKRRCYRFILWGIFMETFNTNPLTKTNSLTKYLHKENGNPNDVSVLQITETQSKFSPKLPTAATMMKMRKIQPGDKIISINGSPLINPFSIFIEKGIDIENYQNDTRDGDYFTML
ncbi:3090_t:CDS:2 [Diversispora eburnea]|uniref:3090_t:CDS:1 n=1 Tax=Diversispora eburnea TaxID=1213867 RepID=A0A9N8YV59_9GLOM|nr:3090_t:CDS:2 [Diversispora eburnea]